MQTRWELSCVTGFLQRCKQILKCFLYDSCSCHVWSYTCRRCVDESHVLSQSTYWTAVRSQGIQNTNINLTPSEGRLHLMEPLNVTHIQTVSAFCECPSQLLKDGVVAIPHPAWKRQLSGTFLRLYTRGQVTLRQNSTRMSFHSRYTPPWVKRIAWGSWTLFAIILKIAADGGLSLSSLCKFARPTAEAVCVRCA